MAHVLVCLDGHPKSHILLTTAQIICRNESAELHVLYVESPDQSVGDAKRKEATLRLLSRAEDQGATITHQVHSNVATATIDYINACVQSGDPITHIVVGSYAGNENAYFKRSNLSDKLLKAYGRRIIIDVVKLDGSMEKPGLFSSLNLGSVKAEALIAPFAAVGLALMVTEGLRELLPTILHRINTPNFYLIFLFAGVIVSLRYGLLSALMASLLSFLAVNYFYTIPYYQLNIGTTVDLINIVIFFTASIVVAIMGSSVRTSVEASRRREVRSKALYEIANLTADADSRHQIMEILDREVHNFLGMDVVFFVTKDEQSAEFEKTPSLADLKQKFEIYPAAPDMSERDMEALMKCWNDQVSSGFGTLRGIGSSWRFDAMSTQDNKQGIIAVKVPLRTRLDTGFAQFVSLLSDQVALTLERASLIEQMNDSRFREEREKLRSMLLSSVSHDLKTPLASIIGSISVLRSLRGAGRLSPEQEDTLTETALEEAQRLDSFITNILSMTRIDSGDIEFSVDTHDPVEPLNKVLKTLRNRLKGRTVNITGGELALDVPMDAMMTAQVLQNVIDNAAKYSPRATDIDISLIDDGENFYYEIRDYGNGIPEEKLDRIFDKYERLNMSDSQVAGTGLGLAITQSVMRAQGGEVYAGNHQDGGAVFKLEFPKVKEGRTGGNSDMP